MKMNEINAAAPKKYLRVVAASGDIIGNDLTHVEGVAYSGGVFSQWWSNHPCITDLAGLDIAAQIPLLYNHYNEPGYRLGELTVKKTNAALTVSGGIDPDCEHGKEIISAGKKIDWQLSHGAEIKEIQEISAGETITVNGREFTGPLTVITKAVLREISVVAIGADADTSLRIAAGLNIPKQGEKMNKKTVEAGNPAAPADDASIKAAADAAIVAERTRVSAVRAALKEFPHMIDKAIEAGWTEEYCRDIAANAKDAVAGLPQSGLNIINKDKPATTADVIEAALCLRAGIKEHTIEKDLGADTLEAAYSMRGMSLKEALLAACALRNIPTGATLDRSVIRAGMADTNLPGIMSNVANKAMLQEFANYESIAQKLCTPGDLADYKESQRIRLTDIGNLEEVALGGPVKETDVKDEVAVNQAKRYAKLFWLDEMLITNDDLGAFLKLPKLFGARAIRLIDQVFHKRLMSNPEFNGKSLFDASRKNLLTGTGYAFGIEGLKAARKLLLNQTDQDGEPIAVAPKYLLVPTSLEAEAQELVLSALQITGESKTKGATNIVSKWGMEVVASPYLENEKYENNSTTGYYLFADPSVADTFEIGYLQGRRTPTVEMGAFDMTHFGVAYRTRFDFGIREQEYRTMVKVTGVA
ncbi:MAG: hypothetical protein E7047_03875 [Lentisphaerae bacterium]|nr:hypothetical protein [Lentisphaerota bacterium]